MTRLVLTTSIAVISFSTIVLAVAAMTKSAQAQGPLVAPSAQENPVNWEWSIAWPAPKAPFDETPITPVESAGAPMFP